MRKWLLLLVMLIAPLAMVLGQSMTARDYFLLGSAKYKCHACKEAVEEFTKALNLKKDYAEAYYGRSLAYACAKDFVNANLDIDRAIRLKPDEVLYQEGKARIKLESGKSLEAKSGFQAALRMDSLCWQAWYGLAMAERNIDSITNARVAFAKVIHINPDFPMSYVGRAETFLRAGNDAAAIEDLNLACKLAPDYSYIFELRSQANVKLGKFEDALADAARAIELDPENGKPYYYKAEAYFAMEQYAKADVEYGAALQRNKNDADAWFKKALCNERMGNLVDARKFYGKTVKKAKGMSTAYANRAAIWEKFEKPKKALPDLNKAIASNGNDASLRLRRGFLHLQLEHVQLASDDFVQVTRMDPNNARGYYGLGLARYQNGNVRGACDAWKQAATLGSAESSEQLAKYCNE